MKLTTFFTLGFISIVTAAERPNIVFLMADDLGRQDLGCYGSTYHETPHIDALAQTGLRFENAYASHPVCGPSRSATMTGQFPARLGVTGISGKIPKGQITWPKVLQQAGYQTIFAGKWHMGSSESVTEHGFDLNIGGGHNGQPGHYHWPFHEGGRKAEGPYPGLADCPDGSFLTDTLTDHCVDFIENHKDQPFLVYLSYYAVHTRLEGKSDYIEHFQGKGPAEFHNAHDITTDEIDGVGTIAVSRSQSNPVYAALLKSVDDSVGRIVETLERLKLRDNTIIIFTSDQGGLATRSGSAKDWPNSVPSCNLPYRTGKGWIYDGGVRVPLIVSPPTSRQGEAVIEEPTINTDWYPTMLELAQLPAMPEQHCDGRSILPLITGQGSASDAQDFIWMYPGKHASGHYPAIGIQRGVYKLIYRRGKDDQIVIELYNTTDDVGERNNLANMMPERVEEMLNTLKEFPGTSDFITGKKGQ